MMQKIKYFLIVITIGLVFFVLPVRAAVPEVKVKDEAYSAKFVSQSIVDPIVMEAGSAKTIVIKFKNTGTVAWNSGGSKFISAYTMEPRDRKSAFVSDGWLSAKQTTKIAGAVKPGGVGELKISLSAPSKTGEYVEKFYLASENYSWVKGGYFFLKIQVVPKEDPVGNKAEATTQIVGKERGVNLIGINSKKFVVDGGADVPLITMWQNGGKDTWKSYELIDSTSGKIISQGNDGVTSGGVVRFDSAIKAPSQKGQYKLELKFKVDGEETSDQQATLILDLNVISDSSTPEETTTTAFVPRLSEEPKIRVGVWKPTSVAQFVSYDDDYNVFTGGVLKGTLSKSQLGTMSYTGGTYGFRGSGLDFSSSDFIRLEPANSQHAVFTIYNYEHTVSWKGPMNFNQYRGVAEYRLSEKGTMYVINEVLFEDYVAGIAETSAGAPIEFIKANLVAARSYAYYIKENTDKHDSRYFDVVGTTGDQLYLGYQSEVLMPRVAEAARTTRGMMVTYGGKIVITPYFGNSNGWTRSSVAAWGGSSRPWLVPVRANYDAGRAQFGHGVGMSQRDCAIRAEKDGLDYISLLKYYYTGVEVEKIYN